MELNTETLNGQGIINLLRYWWEKRILISIGTLIFGIFGIAIGILSNPVYRSQAVIAMKEQQGQSNTSSLLSQLGGIGGLVASQLGVGGSNLDRLEIMARNRDVIAQAINRDNLLPVFFPEEWDMEKKAWKDSQKIPSLRMGIEFMRNNVLTIETNEKKKMLTVTIDAPDSLLAFRMLSGYLEELNRKIVEEGRLEAKTNIEYIQNQMQQTQDPLLREKFNQLIAMEVEKSMLINIKAFDVLEAPVVPLMRESPKRKRILLTSLFGGFIFILVSFAGVKYGRDLLADSVFKSDQAG